METTEESIKDVDLKPDEDIETKSDVDQKEDQKSEELNDSSERKDDKETTDDDSEVVVSIGDEKPPSQEENTNTAPSWVKELRKNNRELVKQNRELQRKIKDANNTETNPVELGKKPSLEDVDYDNDQYEQKIQEWYERKNEVDKRKKEEEDKKNLQKDEWDKKITQYNEAKGKLKVSDYEEAEFNAQESLSTSQQGMIVDGADDPALLIYALGKNPKKLKELSEIKQPVKFIFAVSKLETQLKVRKRTVTSSPEKKIQGNTANSLSSDSTLERLRKEASETGNFTKVANYKRQLKNKK